MPQSNTASEVSSGEDEIVEIASDEVEDIGIDQKLEFRKERKVTVNDDASSDDDDDDDDDDDEDDDDDDNNVEEDDENEDDEDDDEEEEDDDEEEDDEEEEDGEDGMGKNFGTKEERETYEKGLWMSYKDINTKMLSQRAEVARPGGLDLVHQNLQNIDSLFNQSRKMLALRHAIQTYDAKSLSNVSDLAEISVRNLKIGKSAQHVNVDDFLRNTKRLLLKETVEIDPLNDPTEISELRQQKDKEVTDEALREIDDRHKQTQQAIDSHLDFTEFNFVKLGAIYMQISNRAPTIDFMKGPLTIEKKVRTFKRRAKDDLPDAEANATTADRPDLNKLAEKQDDTAEAVKKVFKVLQTRKGQPMDVFKFFINPESFGQTVENMFYTSFLVRDGKVVIYRNEDNDSWNIREVPNISKSEKYALIKDSKIDHHIFKLDFPKWQRLIQKHDIREPFISSRGYSN